MVAVSADPATGQGVAPARRYLSLAILLLLSVFAFIDRSILSLMVGPIKADLGVSDFQIGLLQGFAFALFYALCGLPLGWALDRYPRRLIVYLGVTIWSLASATCGLAHSFVQMLFARFGVGVGEATLTPASYAILSELFPKQNLTTALAIFSLGASVGSGLAVLVGGIVVELAPRDLAFPLVGQVEAWRLVFFLTGLPGLLLALLIFLVPDTPTRAKADAGRKPPTPLREALAFAKRRSVFLTCHFVGFGLVALMNYAASSWLPTYLIRVHGWSPAQAGASLAAILPFVAVGSVAGGVIVDALVRRGVEAAHLAYYTLAAMALGLFGATAFFMPSPILALVVLAVAMMLSAMGGVGAGALQLVTPPNVRGSISALYLVAISLIGGGGGPVIVPAISDFVLRDESKIGLSIAITYMICAPIAVLCFAIGRKHMVSALAEAS